MARSEVCEMCGETYLSGQWPFCPHGLGNNLEDPMEQYVDWNITTEEHGQTFSTRGERSKYMADHALEYKKKREKPFGSTLYFDMKR